MDVTTQTITVSTRLESVMVNGGDVCKTQNSDDPGQFILLELRREVGDADT